MSIFHPVMDQVCGGTIIPTLAPDKTHESPGRNTAVPLQQDRIKVQDPASWADTPPAADDPLDLAIELTFPASDPPAITPLAGVGSARSKPSLSSLPDDWMVS
jgi:hypothetical protein